MVSLTPLYQLLGSRLISHGIILSAQSLAGELSVDSSASRHIVNSRRERGAMPIDKAFADALEDLSLEPLGTDGESWADSLVAGYSMPETGASSDFPACSCCSCILG
jgi:hypothetical protein